MTATCDGCGTRSDVRRDFLTAWNGNSLDLCTPCSVPVSSLFDRLWARGRGLGEPAAEHVEEDPFRRPAPRGGDL